MFSLQLPQRDERGFTLIELLVVIIIIGILAAIAIPLFLDQRKLAADASVKSDVRNTVLAVQQSFAAGSGVVPSEEIATGVSGRASDAYGTYVQDGGKIVSSSGNTLVVNIQKDGSYTIGGYRTAGDGAKHTGSASAYDFDSKTGQFTTGAAPAQVPSALAVRNASSDTNTTVAGSTRVASNPYGYDSSYGTFMVAYYAGTATPNVGGGVKPVQNAGKSGANTVSDTPFFNNRPIATSTTNSCKVAGDRVYGNSPSYEIHDKTGALVDSNLVDSVDFRLVYVPNAYVDAAQCSMTPGEGSAIKSSGDNAIAASVTLNMKTAATQEFWDNIKGGYLKFTNYTYGDAGKTFYVNL